MTTTRQATSTVVGVFEDRRQAEQALGELERLGFGPDQLGYAIRDSESAGGTEASGGRAAGEVTTDTGPGSGALTGLATGGVLGGLVGAAAALLIPGVGPVVAAGILGPILGSAAAGAGIGAVGGGLLGGLVTTGVPEDEARYYDEEFRAGRAVVTVRAGERAEEARRVLDQYGAYDVNSRGAGATAAAAPEAPHAGQATRATGAAALHGAAHEVREEGAVRVPEVEERLNVEKRERELGEVRIEKHVETEQKTVPVELRREEVHVERRDVGERPLTDADRAAFEEGTIRIPVRGEEAVVTKQAVVTGEVVINKERTTERENVTDTVRRTEVEVDRDARSTTQGDTQVTRESRTDRS